MKDLVIIGAGPAGITAAIYAARKMLDFTLLGVVTGGQASWAGEIENYPGFQILPGLELANKFREHLKTYSFDFLEGQETKKVEKLGRDFKVTTTQGKEIEASAVIIATGKRPRLLNVPGEAEFKNKGVAYCATCDGPLFKGKAVAVVGGGNSALDAALQMIRLSPKVYLINIADELTGDPVMCDKLRSAEHLEILNSSKVVRIKGEKFVKALEVETAGKLREIQVEGVFVEIGLAPNSGLIDFVQKNERQEIIVNCGAETSHPGVFAAGDVTSAPDKQIVIAAGEGAKACLSAFSYLSRRR